MIRPSPQGYSLSDFYYMLRRHVWACTCFFVLVVALAVCGILLSPHKYRSDAKLFVKENLRIDPTATDEGQLRSFDSEREAEMLSVVALLDNRSLYQHVVDQLGIQTVMETDLERSLVDQVLDSVGSLLSQSAPIDERVAEEKAIRRLQKAIKIEHYKKSHVIALSYKSPSAERAQQILNTFVEACLAQHVQFHNNPESHAFFEEEERLLQQSVVDAKQKLRDAKNAVGLISVDSQRKLVEDHITNLDREILATTTALAGAKDKIAKLRAQLPFEMQQPSSTSSFSTNSLDEMRNQLFTAEMQYRKLSAMYQPNHPEVLVMKEQVEETQIVLNQQQLVSELSTADVLQSKMQALVEDYEATKTRLLELNEDEVQIAELERHVDELMTSHRLYVKKLEQARLDNRLELGNISNLRLAQSPTRMGKPLSRGGLLIGAMAMCGGLLGAVGLAYLLDQRAEHRAGVSATFAREPMARSASPVGSPLGSRPAQERRGPSAV